MFIFLVWSYQLIWHSLFWLFTEDVHMLDCDCFVVVCWAEINMYTDRNTREGLTAQTSEAEARKKTTFRPSSLFLLVFRGVMDSKELFQLRISALFIYKNASGEQAGLLPSHDDFRLPKKKEKSKKSRRKTNYRLTGVMRQFWLTETHHVGLRRKEAG